MKSSESTSPAKKASVRRSVVRDAGVDEGAVDMDEGVGEDDAVEVGATAAFEGDDISIDTDPVDGDACAPKSIPPEWLLLNFEGPKVVLSPDC